MRRFCGVPEWWDDHVSRLNGWIGKSRLGLWFCIEERGSTFTRELRAGTVTFLTVAYIMAVNANIISDTGGTCSSADCTGPFKGQQGCVFTDDPGYMLCVAVVRSNLVTATAASSLIACFIMGAFANMPLALAPGMGLNAYFAYNVVGYRGSGNVKYEQALAAIFVEGVLFVVLALTGVRQTVIKMVPRSIMLATSSGIGLFLAFIGLQAQEGLGVATYSESTVVTLGGCPARYQRPTYVISDPAAVCRINSTGDLVANLGIPSPTYKCIQGRMTSPTMWLGIAGFFLSAVMLMRRIKGSIMIGIVFVTVIAWIPHHMASFLGSNSSIAGGEARLNNFKHIVQAPSLSKTGLALDFSGFNNGHLWLALLTFLYVDFLDCTGTLFSMANYLNGYIPGFVNEAKQFPRQKMAFVVDGLATTCGSLMGTSPVSTYIESAAGIREGGRTGITALVCSVYFFISLFFVPVLSNIPPFAVGGALIIIGALMVSNVAKIKWELIGEAIPAFLTIAVMPMTYSVAYGVIAGLVTYIIINGASRLIDLCHRLFTTVSSAVLRRPHQRKREEDERSENEYPDMSAQELSTANLNPKFSNGSTGGSKSIKKNGSSSSSSGGGSDIETGLQNPSDSKPAAHSPPSPGTHVRRASSHSGIGTGLVGLGHLRGMSRDDFLITTPGSTPEASQHGAKQGVPALLRVLPSSASSRDHSPSPSMRRSSSTVSLFGSKGAPKTKAVAVKPRRATEGTIPLQPSKSRRVETQTFDDAWGDDDERQHGPNSSFGSSGGASSFNWNGIMGSSSPLDHSLLDFPGPLGSDVSPTASTDGSSPTARTLTQSSAAAAKSRSELPDMSDTPSALALKTFADIFNAAQQLEGEEQSRSSPPAGSSVHRVPSNNSQNEATNELTMRHMLIDVTDGRHERPPAMDAADMHRGKMPVFAQSEACPVAWATPAAPGHTAGPPEQPAGTDRAQSASRRSSPGSSGNNVRFAL